MSDYSFKINLGGLIDLLSNHLYEQPMSFLRELMQNSVDAITTRQFEHADELTPQIACELIRDDRTSILLFEDNGCGLTEIELHKYLSTIASSSKRGDLAEGGAFIGKFGIGFLACFIVADKITVFSKKKDHEGVAWVGKVDGSYHIEKNTHRSTPGTTIHLRIKENQRDLINGACVARWLKRYGSLLPFSVTFKEEEQQTIINMKPPWLSAFKDESVSESAHLQFAAEVLQEDQSNFLTALPLVDPSGHFEATAVVMRQKASPNVRPQHAVYFKRMFLNFIDDITPSWAFFIRLIINVNDVSPTASREGIRKDECHQNLLVQLEENLKRWLLHTVIHQPETAETIVGLHGNALRQLASEDNEACQLIGPLLKVETSHGVKQIREIIDGQQRLCFVTSVDEFRQLLPLLAIGDSIVINAGYTAIEAVIRLLGPLADVPIQQITGEKLSKQLNSVPERNQDACLLLARQAESALLPYNVSADVRAFEPRQLPALVHLNEAAWNQHHAAETMDNDGIFAHLVGKIETTRVKRAHLILNWNHSLIQKLSRLSKNQLEIPIQLIYVQAMLQGHHTLNNDEQGIIEQGIEDLIASRTKEDGLL